MREVVLFRSVTPAAKRRPTSPPPAPWISRRRKAIIEYLNNITEDEKTQYWIRIKKGAIRSPLPFVRLSFVPPSSETFKHFEFSSTTRFSPNFAKWFNEASHLAETFLEETPTDEQSFEILKGYRDGDVTFFGNLLTEERGKELEVMNEHARRIGLKRTTVEITLLHWVTNNDDLDQWLEVKVEDTLKCREWLDTHAHPGWYYPLAEAAVKDGRKVLLRIRIPLGTKALRVPIFEVSETVVNDSEDGRWTHNEEMFGLEEVRLPPGVYTVTFLYPCLKYDGQDVLVVDLLYRAPFEPVDLLALRAESQHVEAMAVLAYTNMWDQLINNLLIEEQKFERREDDYKQLTEEEYAQQLAPVFAFFAPLETLNDNFPSDSIEFTDKTIALRLGSDVQLGRKLQKRGAWACQLRLTVTQGALSERLVNDIVTKVILPVMKGDDTDAQAIWIVMLQELRSKLMGTMRPLRLSPSASPLVLYHGCTVIPGTTPQAKFDEMSKLFVSTTDEYQIATTYADSKEEEEWVLILSLEAGVRLAVVQDILSLTWQCWAGERETILAPEARFTLECDEPTMDQGMHVWKVRVSDGAREGG